MHKARPQVHCHRTLTTSKTYSFVRRHYDRQDASFFWFYGGNGGEPRNYRQLMPFIRSTKNIC
jgi:hypothetical protein